MHEEIVFAVEMERRVEFGETQQKALDLFESRIEQAVVAARPRHDSSVSSSSARYSGEFPPA